MIVIPDRKLILLLPWKTGSQTLRARLAGLGHSPYPEFFAFNPWLSTVVHQHLLLSQFMALPEARLGYRLAAFVRNPYDRVVSGFLQLQRDAAGQPGRPFPAAWIEKLVMQQLQDHSRRIVAAAGDVNAWFRLLPAHAVRCGGRDTSLPLHPCHFWTHQSGQRAAAFIGRVESFEADFARLCAEFDLPVSAGISVNVSTDLSRQRDANGYEHAHRLAPDVIARINRLFAGDFRLLGYAPLPGEPGPGPHSTAP